MWGAPIRQCPDEEGDRGGDRKAALRPNLVGRSNLSQLARSTGCHGRQKR